MSGTLTQGLAYALHCYTCGSLVGGQLALDGPAAAQLLLYATVPGESIPGPLELFAPIITSYLIEQSERHAAHHFVVHAMDTPQLVLWLFQPLVELVTAAPLVRRRAAKILFREADAGAAQLDVVPLVMGHGHVKLLYDLLLNSSKNAPSQLGPWMIGWLPRT